jgi:hypothetical protein
MFITGPLSPVELSELGAYCRRTHVVALSVTWAGLDPQALATILNGGLPELEALSLSHNDLGDEGAHLIAQADLRGLTELALARNQMTGAGLRALGDGPLSASLECLNIAFNPMEPGAHAKLCSLPKLEVLMLRAGGSVTSEVLRAWTASGLLGRLTRLDLQETNLTDECLAELKVNPDRLEMLSKRSPAARQ